ncbi:MAG TPA: hypothetical protein VF283_07480 [Bryobacteraceae bacterium]
MTGKALDETMHLIMSRLKGVVAILLSHVHSKSLRNFPAHRPAGHPVSVRSPLRDALVRGFGDSYQP